MAVEVLSQFDTSVACKSEDGYNFLDLFAGMGGFSLGAKWAGVPIKRHYFCEQDPPVLRSEANEIETALDSGWFKEAQVKALRKEREKLKQEATYVSWLIDKYKRNFEEAIYVGDIRNINLQRDGKWIIAGGFPCQDLSTAKVGAEGIAGARSGLWFRMLGIIRLFRPDLVVVENVPALTFRGLDAVLGSLARIGYDAEWQVIRASDMGATHQRKRIWIVAYPQGTGATLGNFDRQRSQGRRSSGKRPGQWIARPPGSGFWSGVREREGRDGITRFVKPGIFPLSAGVPRRVFKLKAIGNSIVPQIAELLFNLAINSGIILRSEEINR